MINVQQVRFSIRLVIIKEKQQSDKMIAQIVVDIKNIKNDLIIKNTQ